MKTVLDLKILICFYLDRLPRSGRGYGPSPRGESAGTGAPHACRIGRGYPPRLALQLGNGTRLERSRGGSLCRGGSIRPGGGHQPLTRGCGGYWPRRWKFRAPGTGSWGCGGGREAGPGSGLGEFDVGGVLGGDGLGDAALLLRRLSRGG
jgi:hypothetical protein